MLGQGVGAQEVRERLAQRGDNGGPGRFFGVKIFPSSEGRRGVLSWFLVPVRENVSRQECLRLDRSGSMQSAEAARWTPRRAESGQKQPEMRAGPSRAIARWFGGFSVV